MSESVPPVRLKRVLGLWDLIFYGIVLIQPIAAIGPFGGGQVNSRGHVILTILIGMFAMLLTAISFGRMASVYPSAGSTYTYVSRGLHPHVGFLAGWAMVLDYLMLPLVSLVYAALTLARIVPHVRFGVWIVVLMTLTTLLNLRGMRTTARSNMILLAGMCVVIAAFFWMSTRYVLAHEGVHGLFSTQPFFDAKTFKLSDVLTATSLTALTYIGFDGVTMLAEDVENPRRNVLLATVLVCAITGVFSALQLYFAVRVWPTYNDFPNVDTAFLDICGRAGGVWLFQAMAVTLFVACLGSTLTAQVGAARLLYGMGRDGVLPRKAFGHLSAKGVPTFNILLIGAVTVVGAFCFNYEEAAEVLTFGALIAFMFVNLAVVKTFYFNDARNGLLLNVVAPLFGFAVCGAVWWQVPRVPMMLGAAWIAAGVVWLAVLTRGFRNPPAQMDFSE